MSAPDWKAGDVVVCGNQQTKHAYQLLLLQRAPGDDGWLAADDQGVVFFDAVARLHLVAVDSYAKDTRTRIRRRMRAGRLEWFGMRPVRLRGAA